MKNSKTFGALMGLAFSVSAGAGQYNAVLDIGDALPEFTDLPSISGEPLSSHDLTEDIIVLVSLANHCPWVKGMDGDMVDLANSFANQSVRFVGFAVNLREDDLLPAMVEHAHTAGYPIDYVHDASQKLGVAMGATRTPEYFVFDRDRKLRYMGLLYNSPAKMNADGSVRHINGEPSEFYVADAINALLTGQDVAITETRAHGCSVKYES